LSAISGNNTGAFDARLCLPTPAPGPSFQSICALIIIITTCTVADAAHYLELDCSKQDSQQEATRVDIAAAGLHFLAALVAHAAQMDAHAPAAPESLATTEATNASITGILAQDCVLAAVHWPCSLISFAPAMLPQLYEKLVLAPVSILSCCHIRFKNQLPGSTKAYALMANAL